MIDISSICYIVGASCNNECVKFNANSSDYIIAADGGYELLEKSNIASDVVIGDFDSLKSEIQHHCIIRHPEDKDDTDSFLAYKLGYEKGYRTFVIYGGTGGRLDHTIANVQMLCNMAKNGARGFLVGENTIITAIHNSKISFSNENRGKFGVFSHGSISYGVDITSAKYTLKNGTITPDFPVGVSNEFIDSETEISVKDGTLLLIWYESNEEFLKKIDIYMEDLL